MKQNDNKIEENCKKIWLNVYEQHLFEDEREIK